MISISEEYDVIEKDVVAVLRVMDTFAYSLNDLVKIGLITHKDAILTAIDIVAKKR